MSKKILLTLGASALAVAAVSVSQPVSAETTLRAASCFPIGSPPSRPFEQLVKDINAAGKGTVQINLVGGAPAIGNFLTITQKMSRGAYDLVGCTEAYIGNVLPEAPVLRLTPKSMAELRSNGGMDYISKLLAEKNIYYLARHWDFGQFHLWLSKKIDKPDLTGLNLRVAPVYTAFFKSLGATVQNAPLPKIYTLMENNTVQGYGWPGAGWVPPWAKVTKYRVDPGFYTAPLHTLFNLKKWESLDDKSRAILTSISAEAEKSAEPGNAKLKAIRAKEDAFRAKAGMEVITFSGADRKKWLDAAYGAAWQEVFDRSPKHGKALEKLFR